MLGKRQKPRQMPLRLDSKQKSELARTAKARGCSETQVIRDALAVTFGACPTCGRPHEQRAPSREVAA